MRQRACGLIPVALILASRAATGMESPGADGLWHCPPVPAIYSPRQLVFGPEPGAVQMMVDGASRSGRYVVEHRHAAAVFEAGDSAAEEMTLGLASGRMVVKQRLADGGRPVVFTGVCRRQGAPI